MSDDIVVNSNSSKSKKLKKSNKLKVQVLSDIHGEFGAYAIPDSNKVQTDADIILIPGDIAHAEQSIDIAAQMFPDASVIAIVGGNHEHYGTGMDIDTGLRIMHERAEKLSVEQNRQIIVLENEAQELNVNGINIRFIGATFWTDYDLFGQQAKHSRMCEASLNDHRLICARGTQSNDGTPERAFSANEAFERHYESCEFFKKTLAEEFDGPTIVLTHHLPGMRSVHQIYRKDPVSAGFASRADNLVEMGACLWVHGHTHKSCDWKENNTLVVCNPAGYKRRGPGYENDQFDYKLLVDIRKGAPDNRWYAGFETKLKKKDKEIIPENAGIFFSKL